MEAEDVAETVSCPPCWLCRSSTRRTSRLIGRSLTIAANRLGTPTVDFGFDDLSERVLGHRFEPYRAHSMRSRVQAVAAVRGGADETKKE
jgi:hypothetical protein